MSLEGGLIFTKFDTSEAITALFLEGTTMTGYTILDSGKHRFETNISGGFTAVPEI